MAQRTLTYNNKVQGWTSFFSYNPDWMAGMNQYFYTWKGGNLYRHNSNTTRNNFYGVQYESQVKVSFNDAAYENKLFKTLATQSNAAWTALVTSDIQTSGLIEASWFEKKEGVFYANLRNNGTQPASLEQFAQRSTNGIGRTTSISGPQSATVLNFALSISLKSALSIGDYAYFSVPPYTTPQLAGQVTAINVDLPNSINQLVIDATITGAVFPIPIQDPFILFTKNSIAESNGILGHYAIATFTNNSTSPTELFAVESDIMKSYP